MDRTGPTPLSPPRCTNCFRRTDARFSPSPTAARKRRSSRGTPRKSYAKLRDRNLILRAILSEPVADEGLSIDDLRNRLLREWDEAGLFREADTREQRTRRALTSILREALTDEKRLSLAGVGLLRWFVALPRGLRVPDAMRRIPWNLTEDEARLLIGYLLDEMRPRRAMSLPEGAGTPAVERHLALAATGIWHSAARQAAQRPAMGRPAIRDRESLPSPAPRRQRPVRRRKAIRIN